ncbi:MAG: hypothetical protein AAFU60_05380 [Bacteroidota bacterium]
MKSFTSSFIIILCSFFFLLVACNRDKDLFIHTDPEEPISSLVYTLTPDQGGPAVVLSWIDRDGAFGDDPVITGGTLIANQNYSGSLELSLGTGDFPDDLTEEILEEANEHQFFFSSSLNDVQITYRDQDSNGNPIGIQNALSTKAAGNGTITITLLHLPDKFAEGVSDGHIMNAGGDIDLEIVLPITIE